MYTVAKVSAPFSGFWQSDLFGTLRSKLGTSFRKYLLKISAVSSVSRLSFSIRDIFSFSYLIYHRRNLLLFCKTFTIYYVFYVQNRPVCFFSFLGKLTHLFFCLLYAFVSLSDLLLRNRFLRFDLTR